MFLRALPMNNETDSGMFALPGPGGLEIKGDTMSLLVLYPNDPRYAKELMGYLMEACRLPHLGINIFDLRGKEDSTWEQQTWSGRSGPSNTQMRQWAEGLTLSTLIVGMMWQAHNPGKQTADEFISSSIEIDVPFKTQFDGLKFHATRRGMASSMEAMASYLLDQVVGRLRAAGKF